MIKKDKNDVTTTESNKGSQKGKKEALLFDKHVVKPIRGGNLLFK